MAGFRESYWVHVKVPVSATLNEPVTSSWTEVALDLATNCQVLEQIRAVLEKPAFTGLKARKKIARGEATLRATPWAVICQAFSPHFFAASDCTYRSMRSLASMSCS